MILKVPQDYPWILSTDKNIFIIERKV